MPSEAPVRIRILPLSGDKVGKGDDITGPVKRRSGHNGDMPRLLPLFPLQLVVLPGNLVPLHIFEPRYREMVGKAEASGSEFGIVLAQGEGIVNVGCTVVVESIPQRYEDGRFDVIVRGRRRFRLLAVDDQQECLRGEVEYFDDEDLRPAAPEYRTSALRACLEVHAALADGTPWPEAELADPELSFRLAQIFRDLEFQDAMLRERSETARLELIIATAPRYVEKSEYVEKMKHKAGTNGHGHKPKGV